MEHLEAISAGRLYSQKARLSDAEPDKRDVNVRRVK